MAQLSETAPKSRQRLHLPNPLWSVVLVIYAIMVLLMLKSPLDHPPAQDHYYYQAASWLKGRLDIDNAPFDLQDIVTYNGHRYLPLGSFPAVVTLPFAAIFGENYKQPYLVYPLVALTGWVVWLILGKLRLVYPATRPWLLAIFFLSTVYFSVAVQQGGAWFVAHIVTCLFLFLGINEGLGQRRPWLMGLYMGLAAASRFTAVFTFPFFLILLASARPVLPALPPEDEPAEKGPFWIGLPKIISRFVLFGIGAAIPLGFYFGYNYLRFNSIFETGYNSSSLGGTGVLDQARAAGLFGLVHLPKNLYYFFMAMPEPVGISLTGNPGDIPVLPFPWIQPSPWGMSIFLTTPTIIYAVHASRRIPAVLAAWAGIILTAIPIFTYYGVGWIQFGFRYALDFTPLLWLLIAIALRQRLISLNRPSLALWLIILGCLINLWGAYWLTSVRL